MALIAMAANPENCSALVPSANPLTQNIFFSGVSHPHPKARLDNGRQPNDGDLENLSTRESANGPRSRTRSGSLLLNLRQKTIRSQR
jgi:hypothetical protein